MKTSVFFRLLAVAFAVVFSVGARAVPGGFELLGKAQPDEFVVAGETSYTPFGRQPPGAVGFAKVNHDYVWSMTSSRGQIWFGDVANMMCLGPASRPGDPVLAMMANSLYRVCDFGASLYPGVPRWIPEHLRAFAGDWRPPEIWRFDPSGNKLVKMKTGDERIMLTVGFRAAGATPDIVFMAGPHLYRPAINLFAFASKTGAYLGSTTLTDYSNIRRFVSVGSDLYTAVENASSQNPGGSVLRWTGTLADPFHFIVVGKLDAAGMYIGEHEGRLFVTTWPKSDDLARFSNSATGTTTLAGLWMGPVIPGGGLTARHAGAWRKVWDISSYEPDPMVASTCGGGALCSFDGWLYWGTMQLPGQGYDTFTSRYGQSASQGDILTNTARATCVFRGRNFGTAPSVNPEIELLYGETNLPVYLPAAANKPGQWQFFPNNFSPPKFGRSGFGNFYDCYSWSMETNQGSLYIGTFDYSVSQFGNDAVLQKPVPPGIGADLYRISDASSPAVPVSLDGAGNVFNLGFRNMTSLNGSLYLGTASASNLRDLPGPGQRGGGWEFLRLK